MAGIIHKIEEALHLGGNKEEEKHKGECHGKGHGSVVCKGEVHRHGHDEHKGAHVEEIREKVREKVHGHHQSDEEKKKRKEKKKKHEHGHEHDGHSSSSSDSD